MVVVLVVQGGGVDGSSVSGELVVVGVMVVVLVVMFVVVVMMVVVLVVMLVVVGVMVVVLVVMFVVVVVVLVVVVVVLMVVVVLELTVRGSGGCGFTGNDGGSVDSGETVLMFDKWMFLPAYLRLIKHQFYHNMAQTRELVDSITYYLGARALAHGHSHSCSC